MMDNLTKILTSENKTEETINITDTLILGYKETTNSNIIIFLVVLLVVMIIVLSVLSSIIINSYLLTKEQKEYQRYTEVGSNKPSLKQSFLLKLFYCLSDFVNF